MKTRDLHVESNRPLLPPAILLEELPLGEAGSRVVTRAREEIIRILAGQDDRLFVVVGPCSVHDPVAALDYARRLRTQAAELQADLRIVMRVYFEKPRTTVGWKGLINDPRLDGSFAVNEGLRLARRLLLDLADLGLPSACEFLDPITPQFISDLVAWGAIGARTTESQVHRELASGLSMPVGFKNGTEGSVQIAIDAVRATSSASPSRVSQVSSPPGAIPTATSSCAAAPAARTTMPKACGRRSPCCARPAPRPGWPSTRATATAARTTAASRRWRGRSRRKSPRARAESSG